MVSRTGPLSFSGRVAVVTGAGGGLGREYALLLAERGAAVVVNDLGGTRSGEGKSSSAADAVVKEIRAKGGKAQPDYNSVEEGDKIIQTAITHFGRIDILINNAGILRDKSFTNMTTEEWDLIHRVHLRGSFLVTRAAWPYFRKQNYGRIIMTASGAGIYGNFGQANYSAAKLGVLGLSNTLSVEGKKYNIHCNTLVPIAASRLTQDILPPEIFDQLKPSLVSPVVAWLCHEQCDENGAVIEAAGGWVGKYQWERSSGKAFLPQSSLTIEAVRDNWSSITDMSNSSTPGSLQEQTMGLIESLSGGGGGSPKPSRRPPAADNPDVYIYNEDKAILYALAVGASTEEDGALSLLYEGSESFRVLPTFGTVAAMGALFASNPLREQMERLNADPTKLLHGEQYLELLRPLPPAGSLTSKCSLLDVLDKGNAGAVVIVQEETFDDNGQLVMRSEWSVFLVGAGGFGGPRTTSKGHHTLAPPNGPPTATIREKTHKDQAALYRLCGDKNPMHIDPAFAAIGGFPAPILHGLCSLGYATRHVLKQFARYEVDNFKSVMARFASPILPGHTLQTDMWKVGSRVHFESTCVETGKKVISGAYVDFFQDPAQGAAAGTPGGLQVSGGGVSLASDGIFRAMSDALSGMPDLAQKIQAVYEWNILKGGQQASTWTVDLKSAGGGRIVQGRIDGLSPGCTLTIEDEDMAALVAGKLDPQKAFMSGKLKIKGNIMLTQKLKPLLAARPPAAKKQEAPKLACEAIFVKLGEKLKKNPDLAASIDTVYQWNILKDGKQADTWTMDLKHGAGFVRRGVADKPDCTFILEDELFTRIMDGSADPQKAFMSGKLKIKGNVLASQKLQAIYDNPGEEDMSCAPYNESPLKSDFVFEVFAERLGEEPELAKKMKVIYHWNIMQQANKKAEWTVDLKSGSGSIYRGPPRDKADVVLSMEDEDVILMMLGKLNPQRAFMTGRLKIKGNIMLTQKLNQLWQEILKSGRAVELPILSAILADKPFDPSLRSEPCFVELGKRLSRLPQETRGRLDDCVCLWEITRKDGTKATQWVVDVGAVMLCRGPIKEGVRPHVTLVTDDGVFADWVHHKIDAQHVLSDKSTRIEGDKALAAKLLDAFKLSSKL